MLEFFADDRHWTRGSYNDGHGGYCLVGALLHLSRQYRLPAGPAISLLQDAMPRPGLPLVRFNDDRCGSAAELRSVILKACRLADDHAERERASVAANPDREKAGRDSRGKGRTRAGRTPPNGTPRSLARFKLTTLRHSVRASRFSVQPAAPTGRSIIGARSSRFPPAITSSTKERPSTLACPIFAILGVKPERPAALAAN